MTDHSPSAHVAHSTHGIEGIAAITYATDRWDEARRFLADWGLTPLADTPEQQQWETLNGAQVLVRRIDDPSLPAAMEPGATLREVVWGVHDDATLHLLAKTLSRHRGYLAESYENNSISAATRISALDPQGLRVVFRKSTKRALALQGSPSNPWGQVQRIDAPSPVYERAQPVEIGHVVFFTDRLADMEAFYAALGFVTSDRYPGRGVFMRCAAQGGHHDLFLLQLPTGKVGLNHVAFTVRDIHEVFGGGLHMSRCGWTTQLGPGRHPISSAYFWYFENPCGGLIEYNADEDHLTAAWQAREFQPGPTMFAEWAIDGGIDGHTRRQPQVAASGAFLTEKR